MPKSAGEYGPEKGFTDSNTAMMAARLLMQLSGAEDENNNNNKRKNEKNGENWNIQSEVMTSTKIIKEEENSQPKKQRYRSIDHLYKDTKPLNVSIYIHGKKINS
ncbi:hypothetical protein RHMOL_Rhmol08G0005800 [Rhododendron molle]|uniref:Uncharacterized protein n=1 Tax=Rhododendron molle TaxID=49168 RepID=A0ACC0MJL5_RHOML|nr:hypothetical protein RHMOL_Rhmol08G0005800 [Rhododendron molle]